MGTQEGYIIVTGGHMSRCQICGTRTTLTKEIFSRNRNIHETLIVCYDCQKNNEETLLPKHLPSDPRTISAVAVAGAAKQPRLEKWTTTH